MGRFLDACMTVLAVDLQLSGMELMREWYRLLGSIPDIGKIIPESEVSDEDEHRDDATCDRPADLDPHVELA
jgi:hypothetical protein